MRYESLLGVQQSNIAIKVTVSHKKKEGRPRFDMSKSRQQGKVEEFACALEDSFPRAHNGNACD